MTAATAELHESTFYKRLDYGYTPEQALSIPKGMPRWMWQIEQEAGRDIIEVVRFERSLGLSDARIAEGFGVKKDTLGHWIRKWKREGKL